MMGAPNPSRPSKIQIGSKKKIAFVCSGGATKAGAFHLGVALALQEQGFQFFGGMTPKNGASPQPGPMDVSVYVGSSAGSLILSFLAAGYSLQNIFNSFLSQEPSNPADAKPKILPGLTYPKIFRFKKGVARDQLKNLVHFRKMISELMSGNWEFFIEQKWIKASGIFSTEGVEQYMREEVLLSNRFEDYLADLFIIATQLNHSRKVVFSKHQYEPPPWDPTCVYAKEMPISKACAASTSLPFIFSPYQLRTKEVSKDKDVFYIDGEVRDTLSTHVAVDAGADLVFASYTHQPYHFVNKVGSLTEYGLPSILIQSIYLVVEQKINHFIRSKERKDTAIKAVQAYCQESGIAEKHREKLIQILVSELQHRPNVDTIYIHPNPKDHKMFLTEHFSLNPNKLADIVRSGFRAGIETLRRYNFADRDLDAPKVGVTDSDAVAN